MRSPSPSTSAILTQLVLNALTVSERAQPVGAVLFGLNPYRILDEDYQAFLSLVVRQLGTVLTDAVAHDSQRHRLRALADLDRAKTESFQNVSHELRTPLTLLLAPLRDMLQPADGEPAARQDDLQAAVRAAERLEVMVDALLDFSHPRAGVRTADDRPTDLTVATAEATSMFRSTAERAGLRFTVALPDTPAFTVVDGPTWATFVTNLVSNALKIHPHRRHRDSAALQRGGRGAHRHGHGDRYQPGAAGKRVRAVLPGSTGAAHLRCRDRTFAGDRSGSSAARAGRSDEQARRRHDRHGLCSARRRFVVDLRRTGVRGAGRRGAGARRRG